MQTNSSIRSWAEDDRPREKMLSKGRQSLSDTELIAILIGSGTRNESAVEVARQILKLSENSLSDLGALSIKALTSIKGIGEAKAITVAAALELGRRRMSATPIDKIVIKSSRDAFNVLYTYLADLAVEEFAVVYINRANKVLETKMISKGGITSTLVDPRSIFKHAIELQATGIIMGHNHPSGNLKPSSQDDALTQKIKEGGKILDIQLLDHLIIAGNHYYSYADEGSI
jgi:DNA repair protein RadC